MYMYIYTSIYIYIYMYLYADDTLLLSGCAGKLQAHLDLLVDEGSRYGLELNWDKTYVMNTHYLQAHQLSE